MSESRKTSGSAILFSVCIAHFLMPFMMSSVGVALPVMGREFSATAKQLGLVETTYVLSAAVFLLPMGRFGDIYGRNRVFRTGLLVFTLTGAAISQAWSVEAVIVMRFFQGIGGAMINAATMAILVAAFPQKERGRVLGIAVASVYAGISCGPFIGGFLVAWGGWRTLFYLLIPLGLLTWHVARVKITDEWAPAHGEPYDRKGAISYGLAILALAGGAINLNHGWWAWVLLGISAVLLYAFLRLETRTTHPLFNIALLTKNPVFALSNLAALFNYAATFGVTFFMSLYLQYVKGMGPQHAGTILITQPIVQTLFSPLCGRLSDRIPAAWVATAGMTCCAVGLTSAATLSAQSSMITVFVLLVFLGLGFALFASPNTSIIMGSVAPRHLGVASGLNATMRTLGMMSSMIIITLVFSLLMHGQSVTPETQAAFLNSMHYAFLIFGALCIIGIACSLGRVHKKSS